MGAGAAVLAVFTPRASDTRGSGVSAAGAGLLATAAAALGFVAGLKLQAWSSRPLGRRRPETSLVERLGWNECICECGVLLPSGTSDEDIQKHRCTNKHKANLLALRDASEIIVCEEVGEYRAAAQILVTNRDYVLEVGSHVGGTTKVLASSAGADHVVGIDQQAQLVEEARMKLPEVQFELADAFDAPCIMNIAKKMQPNRWSKIFIDISGSRDLPTVIRLIDMYEHSLRPEVIVVKSQTLKRLLLRSRLWVDHPRNPQSRWRLWGEPGQGRR